MKLKLSYSVGKKKSTGTALDETDFISFQLDVDGRTKAISLFSSVTQSCLTLCDPMDCSMSGLPVHHQLPEFTQSHVH